MLAETVKHVRLDADLQVIADIGDATSEGLHVTTTIKASCPGCGEVALTSQDLTLMVCNHAALSYYAFTCPRCVEVVKKPADDHAVALLMSGGVKATPWHVPAEAMEPKVGPTLDYDDLLDLALHLSSSDLLAGEAAAPLYR